MDFNMTEDRQMLAETLTRFLSAHYPIAHRTQVAYAAPFHDPAKWADLADLGILMALAPEQAGGFGGSGFDIAVVFEALGRALCPEPMLGALMAARLLHAADEDLSPLLSGARRYAVALSDLDAPYELEQTATRARVSEGGHRLSGRKTALYGGQAAEILLVAARLEAGLGLFEVAAKDAHLVPYAMIDGGGAAELLLEDTPARLVLAQADSALQDAVDAGLIALCAEAVGAMEVTHATTVDYLKQRQQFGVPIGTFQVLQHRAVDMLTEIEQARSITIKAASELGGEHGSRFASMAKSLIGTAARQVAEEAIQMHGGIAMTWEYPISHYAKRLVMLDAQLGDTDCHLSRIMAQNAAA